MDLFEKYSRISERRARLLERGADPLAVTMERILSPTEAIVNGRKVILVGSNNYLGLTFDAECIDAGVRAIREQGTGTTGSRIANGTYYAHLALEREISSFLDRRCTLVFPTGYQANLGIISGLAASKDIIFLDADSHASIYDGCRLSGATLIRFKHNDPSDLNRRLERLKGQDTNKLIIVEGIYSMLGDRAPLAEFVDVKLKHEASLLVDEAHSLGVLGDNGRGLAEEAGVADQVDFIVGTFSKSLGAVGGFGASNHPEFDTLRFTSRPYMFTASSSPSNVASVFMALRQIQAKPELRHRLWDNARRFYDGLRSLGLEICSEMSPIIAVRVPDEETAFLMWNALLEGGVYVNLALPPGTPNGTCLLRCSVSAAHTAEQIHEVCAIFERVAPDMERRDISRVRGLRAAGCG